MILGPHLLICLFDSSEVDSLHTLTGVEFQMLKQISIVYYRKLSLKENWNICIQEDASKSLGDMVVLRLLSLDRALKPTSNLAKAVLLVIHCHLGLNQDGHFCLSSIYWTNLLLLVCQPHRISMFCCH